MSAYAYTQEPIKCETVYTLPDAEKIIIRRYKRKIRKWIKETLSMAFMLFCFVVLPVVGMFVHWLVVGY